MQDLISIVDVMLMASGTAMAIALTIAPLAYAWVKSGKTETPAQEAVQASESVANATVEGKDEAIAFTYSSTSSHMFAPAPKAPKSKTARWEEDDSAKARSAAKSKGAIAQVPKDDTE